MRAPTQTRRSGARLRSEAAAFDQRHDVDCVVLHLPVPVSVNNLHAHRRGGGVRLSDSYKTWLQAAGWRLAEQRPGRIVGRYTLDFGLPRESGLDLDNAIKATSDFLQLHGVIRNDRAAEYIGLWWQDQTSEAIVVVRPANAPITMPALEGLL